MTSADGEVDPLHVFSFSTALLVGVMILWMTVGHRLVGNTKLLGEGSAACLMGLVVGLLLLVLGKLFHPQALQDILQFDPENFFVFFLPPIIFYAGLSVKKKHFFRNFFTIAGYGVVGTYICFALISMALYLFLGQLLSFGDCLALGAILAATDSVAALQVISQEKYPLLYSMVFGEGVINDATSIVILGTLMTLRLEDAKDLTFGVVMSILGSFLYLFVASSLLGLAFGLLTAFCLRKMHIQHTAQEVALIGMTAYLSYLMGDVLGFSGILSLFVSAAAISHYALHNISAESRTTTIYSFQTLSYISEGIIFVYCGLDALDPLKWKNTDIKELLWMFWILVLLLLVTRAAFVFPVSLLHNRFAQHRLEYREMITIWWAGVMRGAVSIGLVYYYFDPHGSTSDRHTSTMITTTLIVVLISIVVFGAMTKPLLAYVMGPLDARKALEASMAGKGSGSGGGGGIELAHSQPANRRLGGNEYLALGEEHSEERPEVQQALYSDTVPSSATTVAAKQHAGEAPLYQDNDFCPLAGAAPARVHSDSLHEVAIDGSPHSATSPHFGADGFAGGSPGGSPDGKRGQKIMSGLKGMVNSARGRSKSGGGNDDFLFEFEAMARGKEAECGRGGSGVHMVADSRSPMQPPAPGPVAGPAPMPAPAGEHSGLMHGVLRKESSGNDYAPDSRALLARVNRWWKLVDEKHLQPMFGGPTMSRATSSARLCGSQAEGSQHGASASGGGSGGGAKSGKGFTVPATSRRG